MADHEKIDCAIVRTAWCELAERQLAPTIRGNPCYTVADLRAEVERGDATLLRVETQSGAELVGFVVLRVERYSGGSEGVIVAGAGKLLGAALYGSVVPVLERMFRGVKTYRIESCRRGAAPTLEELGYLPTHVVYRKAAPIEIRSRDDLLEELALAGGEAQGNGRRGSGGPDIRSRPGRPGGGGGGSSSTASTQNTTNLDKRVVADAGSIVVGDGGAVSLTQSDFGSVTKALDVARAVAGDSSTTSAAAIKGALDLSRASTADTIGLTRDLFASGLTVLDKAGRQVEQQTAIVAQAYDAARGAGTEKQILTIAAIAAVAVVAIPVALKALK